MERDVLITFISGGARSGKSNFSEHTALSFYNKAQENKRNSSLYYIATAKKSDEEMAERIRIHQKQRINAWKTVEESFDLVPFLSDCQKGDVILIDCLTIWLSNVMFERNYRIDRIETAVNSWLRLAREHQFHLLIVSNDINEDIPSSDQVALTYMHCLQRLHQIIVQQSELVVQVQAGIPTYWKGVK
ncbi:bifunctional adenosylcobinamide kinase/adenosylcobinamide-phosphate guanylyltransferase [Virgibacillus byunsanensis]|uniref:Adenosylcobinamide kinase n=1 Tax=Virgibacillus byunsanensis TaxID=570945 RepID=A0ABW3LIZ4_9BACI